MLPALLYHAHHQTYLEDIPFWLEMARRFGDPILELGCGTGRTLISLAQEGYKVYGLDIDFEMLETLIQRQMQLSISQLDVFQADAAAFNLANQFPLVVMPCNTFSTFNAEKRQAILKSVAVHLVPGGAFVFSVPNPDLVEDLSIHGEEELEEIIQHPVTGNPVQVVNSWERFDQVLKLTWHYDHLLPDGLIDRRTSMIDHYINHADEYNNELLNAGLSLDYMFGDFDFSEYQPDSPYLIIQATNH
jgi:SAM-dependent methyltransferase